MTRPLSLLLLALASHPAFSQSVADFAPPPNPYSVYASGGIDVTTRRFSIIENDLSVGPDEAKLDLVRYYRLAEDVPLPGVGYGPAQGMFGGNETHNHDVHMAFNVNLAHDIHVVDSDQIYTFNPSNRYDDAVPTSASTFTQIAGAGDAISFDWSGTTSIDSAVLTKASGEKIHFVSPDWYLASFREMPNGEVIYYNYEKQTGPRYGSRITSVVSSRGYALVFSYPNTSSDARIQSVSTVHVTCVRNITPCSSSALASTSYGYETVSGTIRLKSFTNSKGGITSYGYDSDHRMTHAYFPSNPTVKAFQNFFSSNVQGSVVIASQSDALGRLTTYNYAADDTNDGTLTRTDPGGNATQYRIMSGRLVSVTNPLGNVEQIRYSPIVWVYGNGRTTNGKIDQVTRPEGDMIQYSFDSRGNTVEERRKAKPGSGLQDIVISRGFPASCTEATLRSCNQPSYVIDARGNRTDYTWSNVHGQLLTETKPAASGVRPVTTYGYTAFTGVGGATFYLRTSKQEKINATNVSTTTWGYNAANKFTLKEEVVDSGGLAMRTCFTFDAVGNLVGKTAPRAGLASCP